MKNTFLYPLIILFVALCVIGIPMIYIYTQPTESLPLYEPAQSTTEVSTKSAALTTEHTESTTHSFNLSLGSSGSNHTGSTGSKSSTGYSASHYSGSTKSSTGSYSTRKSSSPKSNPYASYDSGYEDVYDNDDYDLDRYNSDRDYADGVDDAMEDMEDGDW